MFATSPKYEPSTAPTRAVRSQIALVYWLWLASAPLSLAMIALHWV